jgi:hypothetical protein
MRKSINLVLLTVLALSSSPIGVFAHDGEDDHPVNTPQYVPGPYPVVAPGTYTGQQPGYLGQPGAGHINDPNYNPGHNNSLGHQVKDAINSGGQGAGYTGYGVPGAQQPYGYNGAPAYLGQPGAGHINDPNYNPGHNNSLGHQLKDAVSPGTAPAYGVPGAAPGYGYGGYQGAPVGANHTNNPYINPGHNGSVQHQMNDAVNAGQVFPGQVPVIKRSRHGGHGAGHNEHGHNH